MYNDIVRCVYDKPVKYTTGCVQTYVQTLWPYIPFVCYNVYWTI